MELALMTLEDLAVKVQEKEKRAAYMRTQNGKVRAKQLMVELFEYLKMSGYKLPDVDAVKMSEIWADQMSEYIVMYGSDVIREATRKFVANDHREYRQVPNAIQIIEEAKKIGYNPNVEYARRKHEEEVRRMVEEQHERTRKELTPQLRKELMEKYPSIASMIGDITKDVSQG